MGYEATDSPGKRNPLAVRELAERQWGVVARGQLASLGLSRGAIEHWLAVGRLVGLHRGVYAVGHTRLRVEGYWLAAVLACGPGAVLSHRAALAHHGLAPIPARRIDVTAPRSRRQRAGIRLHRPLALDPRDVTTHGEIPTTTVARTILDTATGRDFERILARAERNQLYDRRALNDVVARHPHHPGAAPLADQIGAEPALTANELEAAFLAIVRAAGLPPPAVNLPLASLDHREYTVDFCWPAHRLIVETDGLQDHGTRASFEADRARDADLTAQGWRVVRFTHRQVTREPPMVAARLQALLAG